MVISPTPETNWASPMHLCLRRKRQRGVGFRIPRKAFRLCVRDVYGTRALDDPGVTLRPTPLQREIELRTSGRQITAFLRRYGGVMGSWAAYRQAIPALGSLTSRLNGILRRYNGRRIEIGLFYLAPRMIGSRGLTVRTHLDNNSDFLEELWRKKKEERKMRRNNQEIISTVVPTPAKESVIVGTLRLCGIRHVLGLFAVTALACLIVLL
jgi:hypothetical protein